MERAGLDAAPAARIADAASLVESNGFAIVPDLVDAGLIEDLIAACPPIPQAGVRDLFSAAPAFQTLTEIAPVRQIVESVLGKPGFVTRAILFDKAPGANWSLRFHQDVAVAVASRADIPGFGPWSVKSGIHHVRPPADVLARMITVRIHLDDCGPDNGPVEVIPGSHAHGLLGDDAIAHWLKLPAVRCAARAGDALLMRPLLLHGSRKSAAPAHRRVAHLEFACDPLPFPLQWRKEHPDTRTAT